MVNDTHMRRRRTILYHIIIPSLLIYSQLWGVNYLGGIQNMNILP